MKLTPRRLATVAAFALVPVLALGQTASAANQTINYKVRASAFGQTAELALAQDISATGPATVAPGGAVQIVIDPAVNQVPAEGGGYTVRELKNLVLKLPVPANSTFVSATTAGGSHPSTVALEGKDVVLRVPGPLAGGKSFELPTVTINLTAGSSGTIATKLGGTSYNAPGLTFTVVIVAFGIPIDAPATAYPDPSPVLTSTTIG
ncbi:dehydratase [Kibdelosporangium banguiense]|uniref:Dehydratase n=1 Tax=Kibdelosporangium banguiense TaxID=1365924 RepID=A0ABS4T5G6_9PSEU|nr:cyclase [Kibdelosporangium banguiense]MBP2319714.1 dehydratase [Kibdelosporangium banguiense]